MKNALIILLLLILTNESSFSQETTKPYLTEKNNKEWLEGFKIKISIDEQLRLIKQKVFDDRVFNISDKSCLKIVNTRSPYYRKEHFFYECKITFALKLKDSYYLLDIVNNPDTFKILKEVSTNNIKNIEILDGKIALAYFGSGNCGVAILINSDSNKLKRKINFKISK